MSDTTGKWQNVSAGPRQVKDLNKALSALNWEGKTFTELSGVAGGTEHRSTMTSPFGTARPEAGALDVAIREKYGYEVTRDNVRAIIADYEAATAEAAKSRPVEDNRRSAEEDAELKAASAARDAEYEARRQAETAVLTAVMAKAPNGAKALIVAEYREDASDPMTDYFNSHTVRTVAIGWRFTSREDFRALAAAAAAFSETAAVTFTEHRDNYSMGAGNYLSDHGGAHSGTGWIVKSASLPCQWVNLTEDALPDAPATGGPGFYDQRGNWTPQAPTTSAEGVTISPSSIGREGVVEVRFAAKPGPEVIGGLKYHGFRWARGNRCWYGRDVAYAEALATA
jgi:hypothetical protein